METQASRATPNNPNPTVQGSPRTRDLSNLRTKEPGSAFRGIGRERAGRGNRGGRGRGQQQSNLAGRSRADNPSGRLSQRDIVSSKTQTSSNSLASPSIPYAGKLPEKAADGAPERTGKAQSRRSSRGPPAVVVVRAPEVSPVSPSSSPRLSNRRRRSHQQGKGPSGRNLKPLSSQPSSKPPKARNSSTLSPPLSSKDVPPHLATAHEAEVRHDIEALVERVRAVAMAENRPTTPGSHIDWAGDEDDSLPDLDDWGVTTMHIMANGERDEGISPILGDTLRQLPEPHSDTEHHGEQDAQACNDHFDECPQETLQTPLSTSSEEADATKSPSSQSLPDACSTNVTPATNENSPDSRVDPPPEPLELATEGHAVLKDDGLSESMHAPSSRNITPAEQQLRSPSSERGLHGSIHAPASLPESPASIKNNSFNRSHGRSHTESRSSQPSRSSRSGASSPLGKHVCTHSRNHSTPPNGASSQRAHHGSRPVITGEAISRLVRTIGSGLGPVPRNQGIPVTKDSTIAS
ncbi:hypothetical protein EDC04DRAFT_2622856 [Pisolithus marmoratus]|nr:hypothetical protein EDC04DRAFT_2622856 [Pisolithus marmoratus]